MSATDSDPSETATDTDPSESDTDTDSDTDPTGGPACEDPDASVDATFVIDVGEWPIEDEDRFTIEASCTIDAVAAERESVDVELGCDDAGTPRAVTLSIAATDAGVPMWAIGLEVSLRYDYENEWELGTGTWRTVALRETDGGALVLAGAETGVLGPDEFTAFDPDLAPIVLAGSQLACDDGSDNMPLLLELGLDDATVNIAEGHRDVLAAGEDVYAIDVAEAYTYEEEGDGPGGSIKMLVRRVTP